MVARMTTDKKPAQRFDTREEAQIEIYGQVGILPATLLNLSETGALVKLDNKSIPESGQVEAGDILSLTVYLDELAKTHYLSAEVVWTKGFSVGINFINKDEILERMMAKAGMI
jgi:hypothetical protein